MSIIENVKSGSVENMTFVGRQSIAVNGIEIQNSAVMIRNCVVKEFGCSGIVTSGSESSPELLQNECLANAKNGIEFVQFSKGSVRHNLCVMNGKAGILVDDPKTKVELEFNACDQNEIGIRVMGGSCARINENKCKRNTLAGIQIDGKNTRSDVQGCVCENNMRFGIVFGNQSSGTVRRNKCTGSKDGFQAGISIMEGAEVNTEHNTCRENVFGIMYDNGTGVSEKNWCECNVSGIMISGEQSSPTVRGNTCFRNDTFGIVWDSGAEGIAEGNDVSQNSIGIQVQDRRKGRSRREPTAPIVTKNDVIGNEMGIVVLKGTEPKIFDNRCEANKEHNLLRSRPFWRGVLDIILEDLNKLKRK